MADEKYKNQYAWGKRNWEKVKDYSRKSYHKHKEARALNVKQWREANKEYMRTKQREDKRKRKLHAIEYKGGKCQKCEGVFHSAIYEFHHTDPENKTRDPSKLLSLSWEHLTKELDNCLLLCANCHRLEHHTWRESDEESI